jgi:hypothetical protein
MKEGEQGPGGGQTRHRERLCEVMYTYIYTQHTHTHTHTHTHILSLALSLSLSLTHTFTRALSQMHESEDCRELPPSLFWV